MKRLVTLAFAVFVLILLALLVRWPGDVPWINDEPLFFQRVLLSLETGRWWIMALPGSAGVTYGPVAWWIYRVLWPWTHDLETMVVIKALASQLICFGFVSLTLGLLKLPRRIALLILVSPYYYFYARVLWDNCFLLPLLSILLYLTVRFRQNPSGGLLVGFSLVTWLALHIHLMAAVFIAPAAGMLITAHGAWWRRHAVFVGALVLVNGLSYLPYLWTVGGGAGSGAAKFLRPDVFPLTFVFWPRFFSSAGFFEYFYPLGAVSRLVPIWISGLFALVPFGLVWFGLWSFWRERRWLAVLSLATLILLGSLHWIFSLQTHPHYAIPASALALVCLAEAYRRFAGRRWVRVAFVVWLAVQTISLERFGRAVHLHGGDREARYGAILANQIAVAKTLGQDGTVARQAVENYRRFPHALTVLRKLVAEESRRGTQWRVEYVEPGNPTGWITATKAEAP